MGDRNEEGKDRGKSEKMEVGKGIGVWGVEALMEERKIGEKEKINGERKVKW
jgi:hypothetical protein